VKDVNYYPLMQRDSAKKLLWQSQFARFECFLQNNPEKKYHPISLFAGAPGIGKTRMLQDFVSILKHIANNMYGEQYNTFKEVLPVTTRCNYIPSFL
jgi:hypothetical protein